MKNIFWLVVLTILKNMSQWEGLYHILWKMSTVPNHQPALYSIMYTYVYLTIFMITIWSFNIAMENPNFNRKTIYFYGPSKNHGKLFVITRG